MSTLSQACQEFQQWNQRRKELQAEFSNRSWGHVNEDRAFHTRLVRRVQLSDAPHDIVADIKCNLTVAPACV